MKKIFIVLALVLLVTAPTVSLAKGSFSSGRSSFSSGRSSYSSSPTRSSYSTSSYSSGSKSYSSGSKSYSAGSTPRTPSISYRPSSATTKVQTSSPKVVSGTSYSKTGNVVDGLYQPKFTGGYVPPTGSVVYYRESSVLDWLPFYLILTNQSHRQAVVTTPATATTPATEKVVKEEGIDTMYVINWIVSILLVAGVIALIVYYVNKKTQDETYSSSY